MYKAYEEKLSEAKMTRIMGLVSFVVIYVSIFSILPREMLLPLSIPILIIMILTQLLYSLKIMIIKKSISTFNNIVEEITEKIGPFKKENIFEASYGYDVFNDNNSYSVFMEDLKINKIINKGNIEIINVEK